MTQDTGNTADPAAVRISARIDELVQENRRLKKLCALAIVLPSAIVLMAQVSPRGNTVEAERFVLRDSSGRTAALLAVSEGGDTGLFIPGADGRARAELYLRKDGVPVMALTGAPVIALRDDRSVQRLRLHLLSGGEPGVVLRDRGDRPRAALALSTNDESPSFELLDAAGKNVHRVP